MIFDTDYYSVSNLEEEFDLEEFSKEETEYLKKETKRNLGTFNPESELNFN